MAIRSPVLTGAGSCGAFLYIENGVPVRPAGFCNVNQLIEVNTEQAGAIEVLRGPGPVLYGSNALHGVYHVLSFVDGTPLQRLEIGPDDFWRVSLDQAVDTGAGRVRASFHGEHDGGYRDESGYGQSKLNVDHETLYHGATISTHFAASLLNQETAGFVRGKDAYRDPDLSRSNPNPEAYRDADSQRLSVSIETPSGAHWQPYFRRSAMTFLQHFLPGQPLEENGHRSAGLQWRNRAGSVDSGWLYGADADFAHIWLRENQAQPITSSSAFLMATRPAGDHYDFDVNAMNLAVYAQRQWFMSERTRLSAGVRVEHAVYDYDNNLASGNNDENGVPCGFGGCLYTRPADRSDRFTNVAPKLAWRYSLTPRSALFANLSRGFRAPQVTELYRLQSGQDVADLDSETLDAAELGLRTGADGWRLALSAFAMSKREVILRDADGFNVSDGRTDHAGFELDGSVRIADSLSVEVSASYARHRYDFDRFAGGGEIIRNGNDVDTAPRTLGNLRASWQPTPDTVVSLEWEHSGSYYLDAANEHRYGGHDLAHFGLSHNVGRIELALRIRNIFDSDYAERADFAFGNYRYFPGRSRSAYLSVGYRGESPAR